MAEMFENETFSIFSPNSLDLAERLHVHVKTVCSDRPIMGVKMMHVMGTKPGMLRGTKTGLNPALRGARSRRGGAVLRPRLETLACSTQILP